MKLIEFQIKNYQSIIDSSIVELSGADNITILAGQNESGKSTILKALNDFEKGDFDTDSIPFSIEENPIQYVSCKYKIDDGDNFSEALFSIVKEKYLQQIGEVEKIFDESKIKRIKEFTISRVKEGKNLQTSIDTSSFNIFRDSILEKPITTTGSKEPQKNEITSTGEKYINISDENNSEIANIFKKTTPKFVFFDDFCDLLPDKIFISALKAKKEDAKGYKAVKNLEKILNTDFVTKDTEADSIRRTKEEKENDSLSVNFQEDWAQRIYGENKVIVKYDFQKRIGEGENGSYINFYIETKKSQPLPPRMRSKGLIWFLSLWLELKAQDIEHNGLILLLDEPDQHLHVKAQKDILKLIEKLANRKRNKKCDQVIYATHSPYLIEVDHLYRIKLIINTEKQGTLIEDITTSKIDTENRKDALQPIADAIGINASEFSSLCEKNVILEGLSDFYYFSGMKKMLGRNGDYRFIPGIGIRQINNLISLSIGYGFEWIAIIDDDPKEGGKDSKKKFDEIKDFVFDGNENKTKEKVYVLEKICGIENMFTHEDLKLIDPNVVNNDDKSKEVGHKRKVLFAQLFFKKVDSNEIDLNNLSETSKENFSKAFNFIDGCFQKLN